MSNHKQKCVMKPNYEFVASMHGNHLFVGKEYLGSLIREYDWDIMDIGDEVRDKDLCAHLKSVKMERKGDFLWECYREHDAVDAYHTAAWLALGGKVYERGGQRVMHPALVRRSAEMVAKAIKRESEIDYAP